MPNLRRWWKRWTRTTCHVETATGHVQCRCDLRPIRVAVDESLCGDEWGMVSMRKASNGTLEIIDVITSYDMEEPNNDR